MLLGLDPSIGCELLGIRMDAHWGEIHSSTSSSEELREEWGQGGWNEAMRQVMSKLSRQASADLYLLVFVIFVRQMGFPLLLVVHL